MFRRRDSAIGPARRPPGIVPMAALAVLVVAVLAGGGIWLAGQHRGAAPPPGTRVELAVPPPQATATAPAPAAPAAPRDPAYERLIAGGDPKLIERGASGPLPMVAEDGRKAWQVYAAPFDAADKHPRIAIVIAGLGQSAADTQAAIDKLPAAVTLAFDPYAPDLPDWIGKARAAHHEVVMSVPMEPVDYPREDPGPETLLTALSPHQNLDRLEWSLSRAVGYVGITNMMGSRFIASPAELRPILEVVKGRGLLFVERRAATQSAAGPLAQEFALPFALSDRELDGDLSPGGLDQALSDLEQIARRKDRAVALGSLYPITIERVSAWAKTLADKDLVLAPVSATVAVASATKEPADKDAAK